MVLEPFSEAESAPIRSAVKFYFDIDVRIFFSTSSKNIFSIDPKKKVRKFSKKSKIFDLFLEIFKKSIIFKENLYFFSLKIFDFLKFFELVF